MEERDDSWVLLVNIVDADAAHPVTQKIGGTDEDREVIELGDDIGLESSTHIIIFKQADEAIKHLTLYERSSNISFSRAMMFINHLCKLAAKQFPNVYTRSHPNGVENKNINIYCSILYLGHPSEEFLEELEEGKVSDLRITSDVNVLRGLDAAAYPDFIGTEIKMKVGHLDVAMSGGNWGRVKKALEYADSLEAPFVRVQFTDVSGSSHTAILSSDTKQLYQADKYVKKRKIEGFGNSLKTAFPVIHEGIRDKMLGLL